MTTTFAGDLHVPALSHSGLNEPFRKLLDLIVRLGLKL